MTAHRIALTSFLVSNRQFPLAHVVNECVYLDNQSWRTVVWPEIASFNISKIRDWTRNNMAKNERAGVLSRTTLWWDANEADTDHRHDERLMLLTQIMSYASMALAWNTVMKVFTQRSSDIYTIAASRLGITLQRWSSDQGLHTVPSTTVNLTLNGWGLNIKTTSQSAARTSDMDRDYILMADKTTARPMHNPGPFLCFIPCQRERDTESWQRLTKHLILSMSCSSNKSKPQVKATELMNKTSVYYKCWTVIKPHHSFESLA